MVGVGENNARVKFFEIFLAQTFYCGLRAHGHERRRFDDAVRSGQASAARSDGVGVKNFERKHDAISVSRENPRQTDAHHYKQRPSGKRNAQGFGKFQLSRICRGKSHGDEYQYPERKNIERNS